MKSDNLGQLKTIQQCTKPFYTVVCRDNRGFLWTFIRAHIMIPVETHADLERYSLVGLAKVRRTMRAKSKEFWEQDLWPAEKSKKPCVLVKASLRFYRIDPVTTVLDAWDFPYERPALKARAERQSNRLAKSDFPYLSEDTSC